MWVGGYEDWTPAEQREWDRDLEQLEREREEREQKEREQREQKECDVKTEQKEREQKECDVKTEQKEREVKMEQREGEAKKKHSWMELGLDDPLYKATFTRMEDTDDYVVDLREHTPSQLGDRNLVFEIVYPLYEGLNTILEKRKTPQTSGIKIQASSRENVTVTYTCYCTPDTWSYTVMDEIMEGLSDQLSMKQNLNRGLLIQLSFIKKM